VKTVLHKRYGTTGGIKMGTHNRSENGRSARVTLCTNPSHTHSHMSLVQVVSSSNVIINASMFNSRFRASGDKILLLCKFHGQEITACEDIKSLDSMSSSVAIRDVFLVCPSLYLLQSLLRAS
jgi:hypothetical protein